MGTNSFHRVWTDVFGPLRKGAVDDLVVVGQIGQSLDGRIATASGHSKYINGPAGIEHLHRLRALVDIIVVGVGTAIADDPQLTVRQVSGPQPVRAVIDPNGRLGSDARLFADDGVRRLLITVEGTRCNPPAGRRDHRAACAGRRDRAFGDRWRACARRDAPDPDRGRRQYRIALSGGALSRPDACDVSRP